jgi:hypothetical protein
MSENKFIDVVSVYTQTTRVEIPDELHVTQIGDIWVKWGTVHVEIYPKDVSPVSGAGHSAALKKYLKDGKVPEVITIEETDEVDTKRPEEVRAYDEDGNQIFEG